MRHFNLPNKPKSLILKGDWNSTFILSTPFQPLYAAINGVWANNGEDKVTRDELRTFKSSDVTNSVWNGSSVSLFGAKNEVVSFNMVLDAAGASAQNVSVSFNILIGPGGFLIQSRAATGNGVFLGTIFDFADLDCWYNGEQYTVDGIPMENPRYNGDEAAHTTFESCENKGRAFWWLWRESPAGRALMSLLRPHRN